MPEPHVTYVMHNGEKLQVKIVQLPLETGKHDLNPKWIHVCNEHNDSTTLYESHLVTSIYEEQKSADYKL